MKIAALKAAVKQLQQSTPYAPPLRNRHNKNMNLNSNAAEDEDDEYVAMARPVCAAFGDAIGRCCFAQDNLWTTPPSTRRRERRRWREKMTRDGTWTRKAASVASVPTTQCMGMGAKCVYSACYI